VSSIVFVEIFCEDFSSGFCQIKPELPAAKENVLYLCVQWKDELIESENALVLPLLLPENKREMTNMGAHQLILSAWQIWHAFSMET
jgi:hypothetical protein